MAVQLILPRALDANGDPVSGAKALFYDTGTTNAQTVYTDTGVSTPTTSPLVADANGVFAQTFSVGSTAVKVVLTDADDVALPEGTLDPCPTTSLSASGAGDISLTPGSTVAASTVQGGFDILDALWDAVSTFGKSLIDDADASAARATLGLGGLATLDILDEDDFASDSATRPPSQQSVSQYIIGRGAPAFILEDQKSSGTNGGGSTSGSWQTRDLNTEVRDVLGIVSISSDEFTVTEDCWVEWSAPAYQSGDHKTRLYNVTDTTTAAVGSSEFIAGGVSGQTRSTGGGACVAGKTYRIEHRVNSSTSSNGHGYASGWATEVYTRVVGWVA